MAGVDVGPSKGGKRATNSEINMVPFIDLLMVTIAFLLITAVWVTNSRMNADAQVPGPPSTDPVEATTPEKVLTIQIGDDEFGLIWKQGATVVLEEKVPKPETKGDHASYPDLAKKIATSWKANGSHTDPSDKKLDQAILQTDNKLPFKEIIGVLDALYTPHREMKFADGSSKQVPVFNMTFSVR